MKKLFFEGFCFEIYDFITIYGHIILKNTIFIWEK